MKNLQIDDQDLRILFLKSTNTKFSKEGFQTFVKECEEAYSEYYERNIKNLDKYGTPKTYSQWVNGQIIFL